MAQRYHGVPVSLGQVDWSQVRLVELGTGPLEGVGRQAQPALVLQPGLLHQLLHSAPRVVLTQPPVRNGERLRAVGEVPRLPLRVTPPIQAFPPQRDDGVASVLPLWRSGPGAGMSGGGMPGDLRDGGQVGQRGVGGAYVVELAPGVSLQLLEGQAGRPTAAVLEEEVLLRSPGPALLLEPTDLLLEPEVVLLQLPNLLYQLADVLQVAQARPQGVGFRLMYLT